MRLPQGVPGAMRVMRSFSWALSMVVSPATTPNINAETAEAQSTGPGWWLGGLTRTPGSILLPRMSDAGGIPIKALSASVRGWTGDCSTGSPTLPAACQQPTYADCFFSTLEVG